MTTATVSLFHRDLGTAQSGSEAPRAAAGARRPPLILLHGLLGSSRNWQTVGRELGERSDAAVFALDLRNHGQSPHAEPMDHAHMAADVIAWLDAQGFAQPVDLLGHSMGGRVAMVLACRYPERVRCIIAVDTVPRAYEWPEGRPEFGAMNALDLATLASRAEAERVMEPLVPDWGMRKFLTTNLERDSASGPWRWAINLAGITAALPALEANPLEAHERFAGEAHFIACGRSPYVRPEDHAIIRTHFPAAQIALLPESGHNPHMEARADFVLVVLQALQSA